MTWNKASHGFTLIELLLYLGVTSIIISGVSFFMISLLEARVKYQTISEVEQQGQQVLAQMTQTIRNAQNITSPVTGTSGTSLTLDVVTAGLDPTLFDLSGGIIRVTEGVGAAQPLTTAAVTASSLSVENLTRPTTQGVLRVSFTLSRTSTSGRNEFSYSKTFRGSARLRQ